MKIKSPASASLCAGALFAATACFQPLVEAASLHVSPVIIEVDSVRRPVAVTVSNAGDEAVTFQAETLVWSQVNGVDQFSATDDLLVVPPIAKVAPNASQVFRIALRQPQPSPIERTYRLILEDISDIAPASSAAAAIGFKFSHNLPVMIAPAGKITTAARWAPCRTATANSAAPRAEACVRLLNAGNRRVKVQTLTLVGSGWRHAFDVKESVNILAGAEREWRIPLEPGQTGPVVGVQVQTARGETLQAEAGNF